MKASIWLAALLAVLSFGVRAQTDVEPYQEYGKRVKASQAVSPLGSELFGEQVSLYNGETEFDVTDIDLPGNNTLPVRLARRFKVESRKKMGYLGGFGVWDVDVPHLHGVFQTGIGWTPSSGGRCSSGLPPRTSSTWFDEEEIWNGSQMHIPGEGDRELLRNNSAKMPAVADGQTYPWTTKDFYKLRCIAGTVNGYPGEGFLALSPSGVKYFFNYGYETNAPSLGTLASHHYVTRRRVFLLATRVEDRFGNYVNYTYSGSRLIAIASSDGRQINLTYGTSTTATTGEGRTWTYQYTGNDLTAVVQPDGSKWGYQVINGGYQLSPLYESPLPVEDYDPQCPEPGLGTDNFTLQVTHPSGAVGQFAFAYTRHYRNGTPSYCMVRSIGDQHLWVPNYFDSYSLISKKLYGAGVPLKQWSYDYYGYGADFSVVPGDCTGCNSAKSVTVIDPAGEKDIYHFGVSYGTNEGRLLVQDRLDTAGTIKRSTTNTYLDESAVSSMPFASTYGESWIPSFDNVANRIRPVRATTVTQDGATFNSFINTYDAFARPVSVGKWSSLGYGKTDVTEYYDDLIRWVTGQTKRQYNADTGIVMSQADYDLPSALPIRTYSFGKLAQSMAYYGDGTLSTITDGRNYTTTLSNWKRGIPQTVQFPDSTSQGATVNDAGWITSVTDENGFATGYGYDAMGRVSGIAFPAGDAVAWTPKSVEFRALTNADWKPPGVSTGQWRQYVGQGNYAKLTYFDAMWRPVLVHEYDVSNVSGTLRSTATTYDQAGKVAFQSYPSSDLIPAASGIWSFYDSLGRSTSVKQDSELGQLTTRIDYLTGFMQQVTNARGYATVTQYQAYDQPDTSLVTGVTTPENAATELHRNPYLGRLESMIRRNGDGSLQATRSYVYDGYQQLCKRIEPETGATVMDYDAAGNLQWSAAGVALPSTTNCDTIAGRDSGRKVTRYYDARNRLTTLNFPDGNGDQNWTYTLDGLPDHITTFNDSGTTSVVNAYSYSKRRLLTGESVTQPGWYTWSIGYGFDGNANLAGQTYPTGLYVDYAPNALGQPTKAGAWATGVSYYPNGGIRRFTYGNGIVHTMTQNARQLPARSTDSLGILDFEYQYDANGNVAAIPDHALGSFTSRWMQYDGLDRLTAAGSCSFGGDCWHRFTYDALDNLKSWKLPGIKDYSNYVYDTSNRLTNIQNSVGASIVGLGYDVQGNFQNKNGQAYLFDFGNRLRSVTAKEYYRYDGLGRRVLNWRPDNTATLSMYSKPGQVLYQENSSKQLAIENIYLSGSLVATRERPYSSGTPATRYQHTDALGSPVAVTSEAGQVVERTNYEPFGAAINKTIDGVGYTGHVMDAATGLTYMQQRYYDPQIARFLSGDPVTADGNTGGNFNRYWYTKNNPYRFTDPDGRFEKVTGSHISGGGNFAGTAVSGMASSAVNKLLGETSAAPAGSKNFGPLKNGYVPAASHPAQPVAQQARPRADGTIQIGLKLSGTLGPLSVAVSAGLAGDERGGVALYSESAVGGGARGDAHAGFTMHWTNAKSVNDLAGQSYAGSGGGGLGPYVSGDASYSPTPDGGAIYGGGFTIGAGAGGGGSVEVTQTTLYKIGN